MTIQEVVNLKGKRIQFDYADKARDIVVEDLKFCKNGSEILLGTFNDENDNQRYRSFFPHFIGEYRVIS